MKRNPMIALLAACSVLLCGCSQNGGSAAESTTTTTTAAAPAETTTTTAAAETTLAETTETEAETTERQEPTIPDKMLFGGYIASDDPADLMSEPDESSEAIRSMPGWTQLEIYECDTDGWYLTRIAKDDGSGYDVGYVKAELIAEIPDYDMEENTESVTSLVQLSGTWVREGDTDTTLWILAGSDPYSGIFTHTSSDGTVTRGRITLSNYEHPDGTPGYCYNFNTLDGEAWEALDVVGDITMEFDFGQMGDIHFLRMLSGNAGEAPDEKTAAEKMNSLSIVMGSMAGAPNILTDRSDTINDGQWVKVTDSRFTSVEELRSDINLICAGDLASNLSELVGERFTEQDGSLYVDISNASGYPIFELESGLTISDLTDTSFTATTVSGNDMDGYGRAYFVLSGNIWLISGYEFGSF